MKNPTADLQKTLPQRFAVRFPKRYLPLGIAATVLSGALFLFSVLLIVVLSGDPGAVILFTLIAAAFAGLTALGVLVILQSKNWRLEVDGEQLTGYSTLGKPTWFRASDIAGTSVSIWTGYSRLYGADGRVLFRFMSKMEHLLLLARYLEAHAVPGQEEAERKEEYYE